MECPKIIARGELDDEAELTATTYVHGVRVPFEGGSLGEMRIEVFRGTGVDDRGGLMLRVTIDNQGSAFIPTSKKITDGTELHIAGEIEARSFIEALRAALVAA